MLCNAMLLAEGWNSPRATICMHLAPTASRRVYQQRVGRVTRRDPGKEAGLVIDFVHPATTHDETIVTLHSLLDRDVYRGGAIVVGPVRRGRGRRVRVERRVVPVSDDPERRLAVLERELWRIAVENLNYSEQHAWAALAGARVTANNWRRAKAMLQHDEAKELRRRFLLTCVQRNRNHQLRLKALGEIAALRDAEAFDDAVEVVATWPRDERRAGAKVLLQALAERRIGRRDQAQAWVWRLAAFTRELHEEYAVQRWPETKRLLGLFVNSSGPRPRPQRPPPRPRRPPAGPPPRDLAARRRGRPHAGGARRCCAAPGCGWPASPPRSPASCFGTSPRAAGAGAGGKRSNGNQSAGLERRARGGIEGRQRRRSPTRSRPTQRRLPKPPPTSRESALRVESCPDGSCEAVRGHPPSTACPRRVRKAGQERWGHRDPGRLGDRRRWRQRRTPPHRRRLQRSRESGSAFAPGRWAHS